MAERSPIEWTDATWNPVVGCSVISPGCQHCYAMKLAGRLERMGSAIYRGHTVQTKTGPVWNGKVERSNWGQVIRPLSWRRPRRIFVNSMSDLFHEALSEDDIDLVFGVMAACGRHQFQVLTKRGARMREYVTALGCNRDRLERAAREIGRTLKYEGRWLVDWPLPNVWLGVSVEDQERADERIPDLVATPAAIRFLSCEPLLGPVNLHDWISEAFSHPPQLDWIITGGESGHHARPMHPAWARALRDQCQAARVPFFFKQWGEFADADYCAGGDWSVSIWSDGAISARVGKKKAGRLLDGREHNAMPAVLA